MKKIVVVMLSAFLGLQCSDNIVSECATCPKPEQGQKVTFGELQRTIFTPQCISCHGGSFPSAGLNLEPGAAYLHLVNVPATTSLAKRVVPFSSSESYLVAVLDGQKAPQMPPTGRLNQAKIDSVIVWIDRGAVKDQE